MSASNTELDPHFYLIDDSKTSVDELIEIFVVIYREDRGTFIEPRENYIFFEDFKRAYHRFKMIGPSHALIKRILTDDEKLVKLAKMNTIVIPNDEKEEEKKETSDEEGSIKPVSESEEKAKDILYSA